MKVDFSQQIKEILDKNNIQLRSLDLLEEKIKRRFFQSRHKALILVHSKVYELEIDAVSPSTIDIFDTALSNHLKNKDLVLIILPTTTGKRYVLQSYVSRLFIDRCRLKILDPRKNTRFQLPKKQGAKVWHLPDLIAMKMQSAELRSIRDQQGDGKESSRQLTIIDGLHEKDQTAPASEYSKLLSSAPMAATLTDISLGGACLLLPPSDLFQVNQLLLIELTMQAQPSSLLLRPLAVICNCLEQEGNIKIHLRFISRLTAEAERFFPVEDE